MIYDNRFMIMDNELDMYQKRRQRGLTVQSLFVNCLQLLLCCHLPLLKYSRCLTLSLFVVTRCSPFLVPLDFGIISTPLRMKIKQTQLIFHKNVGSEVYFSILAKFIIYMNKLREIVLYMVSKLSLIVFIPYFANTEEVNS